jgi:regulator of sigma E protease
MSIFANLWSFVGYVAPFLLVLGIVVFFHELGHFMVGRWCGVKADVFSLGFGPEIYGRVDRHGTRWRLALIPLGGYVKFHGDANAASAGVNAEGLSQEERRFSFFAQPVWKRVLIVAAGPVANFILAVAIFAAVALFVGRGALAPRVESLRPGEVAEAAGFMPGDLIRSIDGKAVASWGEVQRIVQISAEKTLTFVIERDGGDVTLQATPKLRTIDTPLGKNRIGLIGLNGSNKAEDWKIIRFGPVESLTLGVQETWYIGERTVNFLAGLVVGKESFDQVTGPIGTGYLAGKVATFGFSALMNLAAVLSVSIGLINLLPIPLLDGGHLLFYLFEALRGRPLSERTQEVGFRLGLAFVVVLMLFTTFNDLLNLVRRQVGVG